jgi:hypothetical protein
MDNEQRHEAKVQLTAQMQAGQAFQTAVAKAGKGGHDIFSSQNPR